MVVSKVLLVLIAQFCVDTSPLTKDQNECGVYFNNCVINELDNGVEESKAFKVCRVKWNEKT